MEKLPQRKKRRNTLGASYQIITYGCQMNKSDSQRIAAALEKKGYLPAPQINGADLIVVNMCSVRQSAVDRVHGLWHKFSKLKAKNPGLKTVLTGCILKKDKKRFREFFDEIWENAEKISCPSKFIPVSKGCDNFCTYCVVPYTRGPLLCRPHQEIIKEVKGSLKNGIKEIWLLGQNVNRYHSGKINFAKLLRMVNDLPGDFSIRFTSPHPADFTDELIETMAKCKKVEKYLNLPIQSGDDQILKKMNRPYTVKQYKELVKKIRKKMPRINLSTDVIVGFPGESKKQFENTAKLFKEIGFNLAYVAKYSARPGTAAFLTKDDVPLKEKKRREKILQNIISKKRRRLLVIAGPTASGKSKMAVMLAKKFKGEIVSADSRQVYCGMDIGTGKITKKEMQNISHHLLSVASPKNRFTAVQYQKLALKAIEKIQQKGKLPVLCGGTGFYIQTVIDGVVMPGVRPDWELRKELEKKPAKELYQILKKLAPERAKTIEKKNPRRLIRAIEIAKKIGKIPPLQKNPPTCPLLLIGVKKTQKELEKSIKIRLLKRLKKGMLAEVKRLKKSGLSWKRLEEFGLEYRWLAHHLQNKISYQEMIQKLQKDIEHYAKRQMTWFKRDKRIHWVRSQKEAEKLARDFVIQKSALFE